MSGRWRQERDGVRLAQIEGDGRQRLAPARAAEAPAAARVEQGTVRGADQGAVLGEQEPPVERVQRPARMRTAVEPGARLAAGIAGQDRRGGAQPPAGMQLHGAGRARSQRRPTRFIAASLILSSNKSVGFSRFKISLCKDISAVCP